MVVTIQQSRVLFPLIICTRLAVGSVLLKYLNGSYRPTQSRFVAFENNRTGLFEFRALLADAANPELHLRFEPQHLKE